LGNDLEEIQFTPFHFFFLPEAKRITFSVLATTDTTSKRERELIIIISSLIPTGYLIRPNDDYKMCVFLKPTRPDFSVFILQMGSLSST